MKTLSTHDAIEIAKFKTYLVAIAEWDKENDTLPDFSPIADLEMVEWRKKQIKAHMALYEQIYGEKP